MKQKTLRSKNKNDTVMTPFRRIENNVDGTFFCDILASWGE